MAKNYEEFRIYGKQMVDYICDYVKDMEKRNVSPTTVEPGFLAPLLKKEGPEVPDSFQEIMDDIDKKIMPGVMHWNHPNFFAYFGAGGVGYPSILGEMLSSGVSAIGFSWASCPAIAELEAIMLDWYAKALDLPEFFLSKNSNPMSYGGGSIQNSASDAIFACMCSARARAIKMLKGDRDDIHDSVYLPQLVCYASSEAHSCVEKAAKMNLVKFRVIEPDSHDSMRGDALDRAVEKDIAIGLMPFFVVGTIGTTSQAAFDNLVEIGMVCKKYPSLWFHVDGAYGGNSFVVPEMRSYKAGMELADSLEVNPNKLMMTTFDCTCLWVKDVLTFTEAFAIDPIYLQHQHDSSVVDLRHFGTPLSRRFRSLKLYFMFRMYGLKGMQDYIRRVIARGKQFEQLVRADERFEVRNEAVLGLVCFRLLQSDAINQEFVARLNASGKMDLTPAKVKGKYIIRFVSNQENISEAHIENTWKIIQQFADELIAEIKSSDNAGGRRISKFDRAHLERFALAQNVPQELYEKKQPMQKLMDWSTPIVVSDIEDTI